MEFLPFHLPEFGPEEKRAVLETLDSGWLTTGPRVLAFERAFAEYVGARHAVAVNSCTAALHLALEAMGLQEGDEVLVPTLTFAATAEVVHYFKARPVLIDCREDTLNMDLDRMSQSITPKTRAILPVHFGGQPCEMTPLLAMARAHGVTVIEDAAHALPAEYDGKRIGAIGDMTCFSFYATKTITTGEGGMVTTENGAWADRIRMMSLHGISKDAWKRYTKEGSWRYEIIAPGYKYNLTDLAAAIGIEQLKKADRFREARARIAAVYDAGFADLPQIQTPVTLPGRTHAWHLYVIQLSTAQLTIDRDAFIEALRARNIGTSVHFIPLHLHPYYRNQYGYRPEDFPVATAIFARTLSLPIFSSMSKTDVQDVIDAVRQIVLTHRR
jgi:perosamine synthetase